MDHLRELRDEYVATTDRPWPEPGRWTYDDYARLPEDNWRYEVIEGVLYMTPAPNTKHQVVIGNLHFALRLHLRLRPTGIVLPSPIDVRLPGDIGSPVQPDLLFIRDEQRQIIREKYIEGSPDLVIEVLSPSNWQDDRKVKFGVYARAGVPEYWIVDPERRTIEVFALDETAYVLHGCFGNGETASSLLLNGFVVAVDDVIPA